PLLAPVMTITLFSIPSTPSLMIFLSLFYSYNYPFSNCFNFSAKEKIHVYPLTIPHTISSRFHMLLVRWIIEPSVSILLKRMKGGKCVSADHYYHLCCKNIGVPVEITCHDGTVHRGIIDRVDRTHVYLRPFDGGPGFDGPGT